MQNLLLRSSLDLGQKRKLTSSCSSTHLLPPRGLQTAWACLLIPFGVASSTWNPSQLLLSSTDFSFSAAPAREVLSLPFQPPTRMYMRMLHYSYISVSLSFISESYPADAQPPPRTFVSTHKHTLDSCERAKHVLSAQYIQPNVLT